MTITEKNVGFKNYAALAEIAADARGAKRGRLDQQLQSAIATLEKYKIENKTGWQHFLWLATEVNKNEQDPFVDRQKAFKDVEDFLNHPVYNIYTAVISLHDKIQIAIDAAAAINVSCSPISKELEARIKAAQS